MLSKTSNEALGDEVDADKSADLGGDAAVADDERDGLREGDGYDGREEGINLENIVCGTTIS
jgi:hypothetical protein